MRQALSLLLGIQAVKKHKHMHMRAHSYYTSRCEEVRCREEYSRDDREGVLEVGVLSFLMVSSG